MNVDSTRTRPAGCQLVIDRRRSISLIGLGHVQLLEWMIKSAIPVFDSLSLKPSVKASDPVHSAAMSGGCTTDRWLGFEIWRETIRNRAVPRRARQVHTAVEGETAPILKNVHCQRFSEGSDNFLSSLDATCAAAVNHSWGRHGQRGSEAAPFSLQRSRYLRSGREREQDISEGRRLSR